MPELLAGDHTGVAERTSSISRVIAVAVWGMIARNHDHLDAGVTTFLERVGDFRARWIFKTDKSGKGHLRFRVRQLETLGQLVPGEGENAQTFLGHGLRRGAERDGQVSRKFAAAAIHLRPSAPREHDLGRTFAIEHRALRRRMHRVCQLEIPHYYWNQLLR
jgi:hypothetical protein